MKDGCPSVTARLIAAATVLRDQEASRDTAPSGAAEWCERFLSTSWRDRSLLGSCRTRMGRALWRLVERIALPGIMSHWMRRKREIDRLAREAAADGFTQLVVLGAGLDTLAFLASQAGLFNRVVIADHPATLATLRTAMDGWRSSEQSDGFALPNLRVVELDLTSSSAISALATPDLLLLDEALVVVVEGVLMYLAPELVERVLRQLAAFPNPAVRLIGTAMVQNPDQSIGFRRQNRGVGVWLKRQSEPMLWATTTVELPRLLEQAGWQDAHLIDLTQSDLPDCDAARGLDSELLFVAETRSSLRFAAQDALVRG